MLKLKTNKSSRLYLGLLILLFGLFLINISSKDLSKSFKDEPVNVSGFENGEESQDIPERIIIPDLGIDIEVSKAKIIDGYWEVFNDKAGWGENSGFPGQNGNQVIFAHARKGLFLPLKNIKKDMVVKVEANGKQYEYKVEEVKEVSPDNIEVIQPTEDETLTLYTCTGFADTKRIIAVAKRI